MSFSLFLSFYMWRITKVLLSGNVLGGVWLLLKVFRLMYLVLPNAVTGTVLGGVGGALTRPLSLNLFIHVQISQNGYVPFASYWGTLFES